MDFLSGENVWYFNQENPYCLNGFTVHNFKKNTIYANEVHLCIGFCW